MAKYTASMVILIDNVCFFSPMPFWVQLFQQALPCCRFCLIIIIWNISNHSAVCVPLHLFISHHSAVFVSLHFNQFPPCYCLCVSAFHWFPTTMLFVCLCLLFITHHNAFCVSLPLIHFPPQCCLCVSAFNSFPTTMLFVFLCLLFISHHNAVCVSPPIIQYCVLCVCLW